MPMVTKKAHGVASRVDGKALHQHKDKDGNALPKKVEYDFEWLEYPDTATMQENKDEISLEDQLKIRNDQRKIKARQAANAAALLAVGYIVPNAENSPEVRLKKVYDGIYPKLRASMPEAEAHIEARKRAADFLGEDWPSDDTE